MAQMGGGVIIRMWAFALMTLVENKDKQKNATSSDVSGDGLRARSLLRNDNKAAGQFHHEEDAPSRPLKNMAFLLPDLGGS